MLRRLIRYWPNVVRLTAFVAVVALGGLYFTARVVRARVERRMFALGHEMLAYDPPPPVAARGPAGALRQLELNGARVEFASGTSSEALPDFLAARGCSSALAAATPDAGPAAPGVARSDGPLAMREQTARSGYVACFDQGADGPTAMTGELLRRLEAAGRTGDVTELGRLSYLYAERSARGGGTRFIGFRSGSRVNVYEMFPETGDAPGRDVPEVPRPPGTRRTLSAMELGERYAMATYGGAIGRAAVEAFYRREMPRRGYAEVPMRGAPPPGGTPPLMAFERGGRDGAAVSIVVDTTSAGETRVVVLREQGGS